MLPNYELMLETVYSSILKNGDTAIDVGAHAGRHSIPLAHAIGSKGTLLCFEPLPQQYEQLKNFFEEKALRKVPLPNVEVFNLALSDTNGYANFVMAPDYPEFSGFEVRDYHIPDVKTENIKVEMRTLDSFLENFESLSFIKIDAEGAELRILKGAEKTLTTFKPALGFELGNSSLINYEYGAEDYFDFLKTLDYEIYSIFGNKLDRTEFLECTEEQFFWDYIALHKTHTWPVGIETNKVIVQQLALLSEVSEGENSFSQEEFLDLQKVLDNMHKSTSWKITAPLRQIKRLFSTKKKAISSQ